ncbi:hypothetical protein CYMTET_15468 [Cymbomonas tetramitiformis]|uniref:Uncharacterized protein n=1 Tax=Cymbomonas tetramitiformis TaxID=36881 RepID=A0AAE0L8V9_9CHLO|nr:hypothetical protein CYMTET_15468 [Cymbomonas tetramitiformis]
MDAALFTRLAASEIKQEEVSYQSITAVNATKVAQCVLKSLGNISKHAGNDINTYEPWTRFSTQIETAVAIYPELRALVSEDSFSDVACMKDVRSINHTPAGSPN